VTGTGYLGPLGLAAGAVLACAVVTLWRRDLRAVVAVLAVQGTALGVTAGVLAAHSRDDIGLGVTAALVIAAKGLIIPALLRRVVRQDPGSRETAPLVNVPASLLSAAALIVVAYLASGKIAALAPGGPARLAPVGVATVLIGFLVLATRRKAASAITGLLLVDNGVALVAFLLTAGVPLLVELGASLDVLLVVVVLRVLATTMRARLGPFDLDQLRELHD
jgi:hydrogenase-4 component E